MSDRMDVRDGDELNRFWNDLAAGEPEQESYDIPEDERLLLRHLHQRATRSQPDSTRERTWNRILSRIEHDQSGEEPMSTVSTTGATDLYRPHIGPNPNHRGTRVSSESQGWRWRSAQIAALVLLALAMGVGYLVLDRIGGESTQPTTIPAAIAPGDELADSPVIGLWRLNDDDLDPVGDSFGVFHSGGTYTEVDAETSYVGIWRMTGEYTVEVLHIAPADADEDGVVGKGVHQYLYRLTYDPATDTISGNYTPTLTDKLGEIFITDATWAFEGTRLSFESNINTKPATPTP